MDLDFCEREPREFYRRGGGDLERLRHFGEERVQESLGLSSLVVSSSAPDLRGGSCVPKHLVVSYRPRLSTISLPWLRQGTASNGILSTVDKPEDFRTGHAR
jgi:hypothetical protein